MPKKRILVIHPGNLYPVSMAFQDRVVNLVRELNNSHHVQVIALFNSAEQKRLHERNLPEICEDYYLVPKPNRTFLQRKIYGLIKKGLQTCLNIPEHSIYPNWPTVKKRICSIINHGNYDIIQVEAWWQCGLFEYVNNHIHKVIDTHDVMYEKRELERRHRKSSLTKRARTFLTSYKKKELENTGRADTIISISSHDLSIFQKHFPGKKHLLVPIGQELSDLIDYPRKDDGRTILFYGSMGGRQNIIGFWRLYNQILPLIRQKIPNIRLIVLGANPPQEIKNLHDGNQIIITGFVEDVRPYIAMSTLMILPLETSGGFRGRIVDVMAMGVPVIGTHNALDCIGMELDVLGYIAEDNDLLSTYAIDLLSDRNQLAIMQNACQQFVRTNYSLEKTYGNLSQYYEQL